MASAGSEKLHHLFGLSLFRVEGVEDDSRMGSWRQ